MSMETHGLPVPPQVPRLWEVHEVAFYLKANPETVHRLIRERKLPAIRLGTRAWRVDPADLKAFIESQRVGGDSVRLASLQPAAHARSAGR
jgi:excisionase family DNA binding protein